MTSPDDDGAVSFRALAPGDLPMLASWLAAPHVARWWCLDPSIDAVREEFTPTTPDDRPARDLVVSVGGRDVGLLRCYRWDDDPADVAEVAPILEIPDGAVSIDYLIGDPDDTGRGLGSRILAAAVVRVWRCHPEAGAVIVPVVATNEASWRALQKAGFHLVASGELRPENPVDPPWSHVLRIDRPDRS